MNLLKNWNVKSPKTVELILLVLMIAGLCSQTPVLAQPVRTNGNIKNSSSSSTSAFISTWDTALTSSGSTASNQVGLPLVSTGIYNFNVSWGDGSSNIITSYNQAQVNHTYASVNNYTITITGLINGWEFNNGGDVLKIIGISQWGPLNLGNTGYYFAGAKNLDITTTDALNLTGTTILDSAFANCINLGSTGNFTSWNTSAVTHMLGMFDGSNFNQPIGNWDVSHVTDMASMFQNDYAFNQSINNWDVSHVADFSSMFTSAIAFNQPIGSWNTSSAKAMDFMFDDASSFNQSLANWNVSQVTTMYWMFATATVFNQNISSWDVSHVLTMAEMFWQDSAFNWSIGNWNVSQVTTMQGMFQLDTAFNQPIGKWNVSNVTVMTSMFSQDSAFNQNISSWDVSHVINMNNMFYANSAFNQSLANWTVSQVTTMQGMFQLDTAFNQPLGTWNVSSSNSMVSMFTGDTLSVQNYDNLLLGWSKLTLQPNVAFDAGNSQYSSTAANARQSIIGNFSWTITDGGEYVLSAPQSLTVTSSNSSVLLSWNGPSTNGGPAISDYRIYRSTPSNTSYQLIATVSASTLSYNDTGLTNGQNYFYIVSVTNSAGSSTNTSQVNATPYTVPTAPLSLTAQNGTGYVFLSWSAPSSNGGSALTGYTIYESTTGGQGVAFINTNGSTLSYNVTNIIGGSTYYFEVAAKNNAGSGPFSSIVNEFVYSTPSYPQSLTAQPGDNSVLLTWKVPRSNGGLTITGYSIYITTSNGISSSLVTSVGSSTLSYNVTGLTNGQKYYFTVYASNSAGTGYSTFIIVGATPNSGVTVPSVPPSLMAQIGNDFIYLSWNASKSNGGSAITGYSIYESTNGGSSYTLLTSVGATTLSYNVTGLSNGQTYYFEITAKNSVGMSGYSPYVFGTPFAHFNHSSTLSGVQSTGSTKTNSNTITTTSGFIFIFPIVSMLLIYFKRQKRN